jgi:SAM-dependent methyltransferase
VVAIDPDGAALQTARAQVAADNVKFVCCGGETPAFPAGSFDLVVYSLSLHHLPVESMLQRLEQAARLLVSGGKIVIIEPGREGTLVEAEERFGVGCGNERLNKAAALQAIESLALWHYSAPVCFRTLFHFDSREDFLFNLISGYPASPVECLEEITSFLERYTDDGKIVLWAERMMFILKKRSINKHG